MCLSPEQHEILSRLWRSRLPSLRRLEQVLGLEFQDPMLLAASLTHPSAWTHEGGGVMAPFERLEFLGDAVVDLLVAEALYREFPLENEGELSRRRAALVRAENLARFADDHLDLWPILYLGSSVQGGLHDQGARNTILADACEAILGTVYLNFGVMQVQPLVQRLIAEGTRSELTDYKTLLQEQVQALYKETPTYAVLNTSGAAHLPEFVVGVYWGGAMQAEGRGSSKKHASQHAAQLALSAIGKKDPEI